MTSKSTDDNNRKRHTFFDNISITRQSSRAEVKLILVALSNSSRHNINLLRSSHKIEYTQNRQLSKEINAENQIHPIEYSYLMTNLLESELGDHQLFFITSYSDFEKLGKIGIVMGS